MEKLYKLLTNYNSLHFDQLVSYNWMIQYTQFPIPTYWKTVYNLMKSINKEMFILEIGSGGGDILSILCHLNFKHILSYERDLSLFNYTNNKIFALFKRSNLIINKEYPQLSKNTPDVLIMVNCVYYEGINTKEEYLDQLLRLYHFNGIPKLFVLEVIDESYCEENKDFPNFVRLNSQDIIKTFVGCEIKPIPTYRYPQNKVSKTLYCITSNQKS